MQDTGELTFQFEMEMEIEAPRERVWDSLVNHFGDWFRGPEEEDLKFRLEPECGGRLFRDLGNGAGHLWGHVQVILPPRLLELHGPMMVSNATVSWIAFRLEEKGKGCVIKLSHRAIGPFPQDYREGVDEGWGHVMKELKSHAERG